MTLPHLPQNIRTFFHGRGQAKPSSRGCVALFVEPLGPALRTVNETQKVIVLGATGTIGRRTLDVLRQLQNSDPTWDCVGLACGSRVDQILEDATAIGRLRRPLPWRTMTGLTFVARTRRCTWLKALATRPSWFRQSSVPRVCVPPYVPSNWGLLLLWPTRNLGLRLGFGPAGTEILPGTLWPVDSEHAAIAQCLRGFVLIRSNQSCSPLPVARSVTPLFLISVT